MFECLLAPISFLVRISVIYVYFQGRGVRVIMQQKLSNSQVGMCTTGPVGRMNLVRILSEGISFVVFAKNPRPCCMPIRVVTVCRYRWFIDPMHDCLHCLLNTIKKFLCFGKVSTTWFGLPCLTIMRIFLIDELTSRINKIRRLVKNYDNDLNVDYHVMIPMVLKILTFLSTLSTPFEPRQYPRLLRSFPRFGRQKETRGWRRFGQRFARHDSTTGRCDVLRNFIVPDLVLELQKIQVHLLVMKIRSDFFNCVWSNTINIVL